MGMVPVSGLFAETPDFVIRGKQFAKRLADFGATSIVLGQSLS